MISRPISPARKFAAVAGVGLSMWFLTAPAWAEKPTGVDGGKPAGGAGKPAAHPSDDGLKGVANEKAQPARQTAGDANSGFTCDTGNPGVGNGNPAFAGCPEVPALTSGPKVVTGDLIDDEPKDETKVDTGKGLITIDVNADHVELGEGRFVEKTPEGLVSRDPADPAASASPPVVASPAAGNPVRPPVAAVVESRDRDSSGLQESGRPTAVAGVQLARAADGSTVATGAAAPALAATGATTSTMLNLAGFLLGLGGALMALSQRRLHTA